MQRSKIKIKSEFKPKRLTFFAEMPRLNEGELESVKTKKEEEGPELDINGLVSQSNRIIDGHAAQLEELPAEYNQRLHDEIVRYFLASPGRFEQDEKKGLSTAEFNAYRSEMVSKVSSIMAENAPTEEDIRAVKETREGAESAEKASENVKPLEIKEVTEDPGQVNNLPELNNKFSVYNGWNASLQQEAANVMQTSQSFQQEYARYNTARKGVRAYKQFMAYLYPEEDQERIEMQRKLNESKAKVAAAIKKYEATKDKISKYGEALGQVSNRLKQEKMAERDERMRRLASMSNQTEEEKRQKEQQYQLLESRQREMQTERDNLDRYRENISSNRETFASRVDVAKNKREQLTEFNGALASAIARVETALQNRNLSEQAKRDLEQTRDQLLGKKNEASVGLNAAETIAEGGSETVVQLEGAEQEAAERSLNIETHISQQVEPAIASLDISIANLETEKLEFATTVPQIDAYYEQAFKNYDAVDEAVDSAVLRNNLANDRVLSALKSQQAALNNVDIAPPSGVTGALEATVGVPLSMVGGAINMAGEGLLDQATWLSDTLERARPEMNTGLYVLARTGTELVGATIGVAGGLFEMAGGIVTLAAHPIDTVTGLGSLVGLNPNVSAGEAWEGMGKALISYEDFKQGRIGVGIGRTFANIATTATGAGAAGAGGKAGVAAYAASRAAGAGVAKAMAKAGVAGAREAAVFTGAAVKSGALKTAAAPGKAARWLKGGARSADEIGEAATMIAPSERKALEAADTMMDETPISNREPSRPSQPTRAEEGAPLRHDQPTRAEEGAPPRHEQPTRAEEGAPPRRDQPTRAEEGAPPRRDQPTRAEEGAPPRHDQPTRPDVTPESERVTRPPESARPAEVGFEFTEAQRAAATENLVNRLKDNPEIAQRINEVVKKNGLPYNTFENLETAELQLLSQMPPEALTESILQKIIKGEYDEISDVVNGERMTVRLYIDDSKSLGAGGFGQVNEGYSVRWTRNADGSLSPQVQRSAIKVYHSHLDPNSEIAITLMHYEDSMLEAIRNLSDQSGLLRPRHIGRRIIRDADGNIIREELISATELLDPLPGATKSNLVGVMEELPLDQTLEFLDSGLGGLERVHQMGRIHFDIKPGNIFVGAGETGPRAVLGDLACIPAENLRYMRVEKFVVRGKTIYQPYFHLPNGTEIRIPITRPYTNRAIRHLNYAIEWAKENPLAEVPPNIASLVDIGQTAGIIEDLSVVIKRSPHVIPRGTAARIRARLNALNSKIDDIPDVKKLREEVDLAMASGDEARIISARKAHRDAINHPPQISVSEIRNELRDIAREIRTSQRNAALNML